MHERGRQFDLVPSTDGFLGLGAPVIVSDRAIYVAGVSPAKFSHSCESHRRWHYDCAARFRAFWLTRDAGRFRRYGS